MFIFQNVITSKETLVVASMENAENCYFQHDYKLFVKDELFFQKVDLQNR